MGQIHSSDIFYETPDAPNIQVDDADGSLQSGCVLGGAKNTYIFTLNVLPETNLATEFFAGSLDTSKDWISDEVVVGAKFSQFLWKAAETNPNSSCFIVDFAEYDPDYQVTFKVVDIFGNVQLDHDNLPEVEDHQITVDHDHCRWVNAPDWGQVVTCAHNELAAGACAGGSHHDCPLPNDDWDTNRVDCCATNFANGMALGMRGEGDCGDWIYGDYGWDLFCPENSVLVARFGSGFRHDCPESSSHG